MSIDRQDYCGPFLRCAVKRALTRTPRNFKVCTRTDCSFKGKTFPVAYKNCPECSGVLEIEYDEKMVRAVDWYAEIGEDSLIHVHLRDDNFDILIPNIRWRTSREDSNLIPDVPEERPFRVITGEDIVEDKRAFRSCFEDVIGEAERLCGVDNVMVCWGLISYNT